MKSKILKKRQTSNMYKTRTEISTELGWSEDRVELLLSSLNYTLNNGTPTSKSKRLARCKINKVFKVREVLWDVNLIKQEIKLLC